LAPDGEAQQVLRRADHSPPEGDRRKKMVTPAAMREAVVWLEALFEFGQRPA
jgi:hypothetical protein